MLLISTAAGHVSILTHSLPEGVRQSCPCSSLLQYIGDVLIWCSVKVGVRQQAAIEHCGYTVSVQRTQLHWGICVFQLCQFYAVCTWLAARYFLPRPIV